MRKTVKSSVTDTAKTSHEKQQQNKAKQHKQQQQQQQKTAILSMKILT